MLLIKSIVNQVINNVERDKNTMLWQTIPIRREMLSIIVNEIYEYERRSTAYHILYRATKQIALTREVSFADPETQVSRQ